MKRFGFDEILSRLDGVDAWFGELGIRSRSQDRIHQAIDAIKDARRIRSDFDNYGNRAFIPDKFKYLHNLVEAMDLHEIHKAFEKDTGDALKSKLRRAVSGPASMELENAKNSD